ncbi:unnamed protein product [Linum tenue]|uniref:DUF4408 domain-containing protein n=1 Tax=Linum tenue TaxID=586396 RepID=A0AAV0H331_9ROSI|nr:unnamed protein product [Linum tenue]
MLIIMATLLFVSPLISASIRPKYLYFIFNLLIVALAAEAGLLLPHPTSSSVVSPASKPTIPLSPDTATTNTAAAAGADHKSPVHDGGASNHKLVEKPSSEDGNASLKCRPSMPSLFFIAGEDQADQLDSVEDVHQELIGSEAEDDGAAVGEFISGQELFAKAETFIGNFYKQLKMQREDSWNRMAAS